ncbi:MAG: aminotransferase class V-fold PLP-dependent enzyme, partial [Pseudomonadales bacterium]
HQVVGMGEAARIAVAEMDQDAARIGALRERLWQKLRTIDGVALNGHPEARLAGALNLRFAGVEGETLIMAMKDLAVSSGSACSSASLEPSHVLRAIGLSDEQAHASIRFSLGRYTSEAEIDIAAAAIGTALARLREVPGSAPPGSEKNARNAAF